ncbi:hypothetical protein [Kytococcus sedentarius]|uniref:hypothetical protein n=1 Tax=Kytococcus sedentarius TaxID=1276 RepID=UPI00384F5BEB
MRFYPYPRLPADKVTAAEWRFQDAEGEWVPVGTMIEHWEPGLTTRLSTSVRIPVTDVPEALQTDIRDVGCVARLDCPPTGGRLVVKSLPVMENDQWVWRVDATAGPHQLAGNLSVERFLVRSTSNSLAPAGAILWQEKQRVIALEGEGGRFRVVVLPFEDVRQPPVPWKVEIKVDEPDELLRSCAEVWINSQHPAGAAVLKGRGASYKVANSVLKADLIEALVMACRDLDTTALPPEAEGEDTVWWSANRLCKNFLRLSLTEALAMWENDPSRLRHKIRAATAFLGGISE